MSRFIEGINRLLRLHTFDNVTTNYQLGQLDDVELLNLWNPSRSSIIAHMKPQDPLATSGLPPIKRKENENDQTGEQVPEFESKFLILVADDSSDSVAMISLFLQQQGYRVVTAANGEEAIKVATQTVPNLILMDISMPTLDGLGATRRIREDARLRDIPIIAVTAFGTEGFQRAAYDVGVSGYLTKPIELDRMGHLIARLLSPGGSGNLKA
jgi:two-component system cell cycle response regulator DivK